MCVEGGSEIDRWKASMRWRIAKGHLYYMYPNKKLQKSACILNSINSFKDRLRIHNVVDCYGHTDQISAAIYCKWGADICQSLSSVNLHQIHLPM